MGRLPLALVDGLSAFTTTLCPSLSTIVVTCFTADCVTHPTVQTPSHTVHRQVAFGEEHLRSVQE